METPFASLPLVAICNLPTRPGLDLRRDPPKFLASMRMLTNGRHLVISFAPQGWHHLEHILGRRKCGDGGLLPELDAYHGRFLGFVLSSAIGQ